MSRILAIDYGSSRVGLAVTDPERLIATPLETVSSSKLIGYLANYFSQELVTDLVVGYPLKADGSPTQATPLVDKLLVKLTAHFPSLKIHTQDEYKTSKLARQSMVAAGTKKKNRARKSNLDKISATLILQSYLEDLSLSS